MSAMGKAVGIDIGGTKMAVAAVDSGGTIVARTTLPTEAEQGFPRAVERLATAIRDVLRTSCWAPADLVAIGIGCAGPVDPRRGLINNPYTLAGWDRCDIVTPLSQRFGRPVFLENDADAAAVGECAFGAGRGADPVVMLTFGTGIGGAAIVRGRIYRGVNGEHPEIGHLPIAADGPQCYCGIRGCLESLAAGAAIAEVGQAAGLADARAVFLAAQDDEPVAREIVGRAVNAAATAAWTLCHTFLPQRLILGGGIMEDHFHLFAPAMRDRLNPATQFTRSAVSIEPAKLGNDAGLVGAAHLALRPAPRAMTPDSSTLDSQPEPRSPP
jgi:glucokinase